AVLTGRSVVGIQAGDINAVVNFLKTRTDVLKEKIGAVTFGEVCPALLHAAAFNTSINKIALLNPLISYRSIVMNEIYKVGRIKHRTHNYLINNFSFAVAGALTVYDLPDLVGCIAPRKVVLAGLKDQMLEPASTGLVEQELAFPRRAYSLKNVSDNLDVLESYKNIDVIIEELLD
ncbi:hypothetical protein ACFL40_03525, partial [candidate division KSB1 bacterium]